MTSPPVRTPPPPDTCYLEAKRIRDTLAAHNPSNRTMFGGLAGPAVSPPPFPLPLSTFPFPHIPPSKNESPIPVLTRSHYACRTKNQNNDQVK